MLPEWYAGPEPAWPDDDRPRVRRRRGMLARRALARLAEALAQELAGTARAQSSWLGRLEPRAKIASVILLIVAVTLVRGLWVLAAMLAAVLLLSLASGISARRLARAWLGVPLFSLAIILPATLNLVTQGAAVLTLWRLGEGARFGPWALPPAITITAPGLVVAGRFLLRATDCVMLTFLLVGTTDQGALVSGLRRLGMPRAFGMVLAMMQRYLAVLLRAAEEIHLAKLSRTISAGTARQEQRWVAAGIGSLFRRTRRLAEEVGEAMLSRGYDGDLQVGRAGRLRSADRWWLVGAVACAAALLAADRIL